MRSTAGEGRGERGGRTKKERKGTNRICDRQEEITMIRCKQVAPENTRTQSTPKTRKTVSCREKRRTVFEVKDTRLAIIAASSSVTTRTLAESHGLGEPERLGASLQFGALSGGLDALHVGAPLGVRDRQGIVGLRVCSKTKQHSGWE